MALTHGFYLPKVPLKTAEELYARYKTQLNLLKEDTTAFRRRIDTENPVLDLILEQQDERARIHGLEDYIYFPVLMVLGMEEAARKWELPLNRAGFTSLGIPIIPQELFSRLFEQYAQGERELSEDINSGLVNLMNGNPQLCDSLLKRLLEDKVTDKSKHMEYMSGISFVYYFLGLASKESIEATSNASSWSIPIQFETDRSKYPKSYDLRLLLNRAIKEEDYERTAHLRNLINATGELLN